MASYRVNWVDTYSHLWTTQTSLDLCGLYRSVIWIRPRPVSLGWLLYEGKRKGLNHVLNCLKKNEYVFWGWNPFPHWFHTSIWNTSLKMTRPCFDCWWLDDIIHQRPFILTWINFKPSEAWISYYIHHKVWHEIAYPFLNFNGTKDK